MSKQRRYLVLASLLTCVFLSSADQTVVVTIIPSIMLHLQLAVWDLDHTSWIVTGYLVGYLAAMPMAGRMLDIYGHKRVFIISTLIFIIGSFGVATSNDLNLLIVARVVQAVGAGAIIPAAIAISATLFPSQNRGIVLGIIVSVAELGGVAGPLLGGAVVKYFSWQWIFWINVPFGMTMIIIAMLFFTFTPVKTSPVDYLGGVLITGTLVMITIGLSMIDNPDGIMGLIILSSAIFLILFILRQKLTSHPILPTSIFKSTIFRAASLTHVFIGGALITAIVTVPLFSNTILELSSMDGAFMLMRLTLAIPFGAVIGGYIVQSTNYRMPIILGLLTAATGFFLMSQWDRNISEPLITLHLALTGLGLGIIATPITLSVIDTVEETHRGSAAALITASRLCGMTLIMATLSSWGTHRFNTLTAHFDSPIPVAGQTSLEFTLQVQEFYGSISAAGIKVFSEFFMIGGVLCLLAIITALAISKSRTSPLT